MRVSTVSAAFKAQHRSRSIPISRQNSLIRPPQTTLTFHIPCSPRGDSVDLSGAPPFTSGPRQTTSGVLMFHRRDDDRDRPKIAAVPPSPPPPLPPQHRSTTGVTVTVIVTVTAQSRPLSHRYSTRTELSFPSHVESELKTLSRTAVWFYSPHALVIY